MTTPGRPQQPGPSKKGGAGKIIGPVVAFVLVVGGVILVRSLIGDDIDSLTGPSAKAGDCASVTGTTSSPKYKKVDCTSSEANYVIAKAMNSTSEACPGKEYAEYAESGRRGFPLKLCLVEKLEEGRCYEKRPARTNMEGMKIVDCSKGNDEFTVQKVIKVEKVVKSATAECGGATPLSYAEPAPGITYCLSAPAAK